MSEEQEVREIRELLAPIAELDVDDVRSERIRQLSHRAMADAVRSEPSWIDKLRRGWLKLEPGLVFAVAAVYVGNTLRVLISYY